jgi:hypothetical protein
VAESFPALSPVVEPSDEPASPLEFEEVEEQAMAMAGPTARAKSEIKRMERKVAREADIRTRDA